ncbi:hypothetical protein IF1G_02253 [Cordyceps javanica]|uniref:Uncharacterized protein n=1 Tax=Cordyceps javanica TaxID=43265 RepID=A0A545VE95_9HYPO|nr:hypothetical protein IF1G_02253 [Cordyceps javanica]
MSHRTQPRGLGLLTLHDFHTTQYIKVSHQPCVSGDQRGSQIRIWLSREAAAQLGLHIRGGGATAWPLLSARCGGFVGRLAEDERCEVTRQPQQMATCRLDKGSGSSLEGTYQ